MKLKDYSGADITNVCGSVALPGSGKEWTRVAGIKTGPVLPRPTCIAHLPSKNEKSGGL
jgi:hypothetical protein